MRLTLRKFHFLKAETIVVDLHASPQGLSLGRATELLDQTGNQKRCPPIKLYRQEAGAM
jgi:hypothetical protein